MVSMVPKMWFHPRSTASPQEVCPGGDGPRAVATGWRRSDSLLLVLHGERRDMAGPNGPKKQKGCDQLFYVVLGCPNGCENGWKSIVFFLRKCYHQIGWFSPEFSSTKAILQLIEVNRRARQASLKSRKRLTWATPSRAMRFRLKYVLGMIDECMIVLSTVIIYSIFIHSTYYSLYTYNIILLLIYIYTV